MNDFLEFEQRFFSTTKLSKVEIEKLNKWFNKQNILVKIEVFKEQKNQFFKYVKVMESKEIVPIIAYYLAIQHFYNLEKAQTKKNKSMNLKELQNVTDFSIKQYKSVRLKAKREKLLNLWSVVQKLKAEQLSLREISKHLQAKHRFKISHTLVAQVWNEVENGN